MNKQNAINAIKFLDEVQVKGHNQREAMNAVCADLLAIVNTDKDKNPNQDNDGKTNAK